MTCGPYTATNVDPGPSTPCLTSTLTVRVNTSMTSSLIMVGTQDVSAQNNIMNTTQIMVIGKNVSIQPVGNFNQNHYPQGWLVALRCSIGIQLVVLGMHEDAFYRHK